MKRERDPWEPLPLEATEESFRRALTLLLSIIFMMGIALIAIIIFHWKF